jgi:rhamnosyltransferase
MKVSVVIPILNPPDSFFDDIVPRIRTQSVIPEIVLINSGEDIPDGPYRVVTIAQSEFNHSNTRNLALRLDSDFVLFMTQDATPYDHYLISNLLQSFNDPNVVSTYARQLPYPDADPIEKYARERNYPENSCTKSITNLSTMGIKTFFSSDSCAMYRMEYFRSVGGFTPNLDTNEDMEFAARAIMAHRYVVYNADAKVYHSHYFSYKDLWERYRRIGSFFKTHQWVLECIAPYRSTESTGISQAVDELRYIARNAPLHIVDSFIRSWIKFIAFKF